MVGDDDDSSGDDVIDKTEKTRGQFSLIILLERKYLEVGEGCTQFGTWLFKFKELQGPVCKVPRQSTWRWYEEPNSKGTKTWPSSGSQFSSFVSEQKTEKGKPKILVKDSQ